MSAADPSDPVAKPWLERSSVACAVYAGLALVMLHGVLLTVGQPWLGSKDWNAFLGQAQAELSTWRDFGELPLWNPWRRGGQVSFAQPESMLLSPVTLLALVVGVLEAFKLVVVPLFVVGCLGFHAFASTLGLRGSARFVPALTFFGSAVFPLYVSGGLPNWLHGLAILPWLVRSVWLCGERGHERHVLVAGALHAFLLWCGSIHHFVFFPIVLGLVALARAATARSPRPLIALALVFVVSVGIAAPRLLPMFDLYSHFPRETAAEGRALRPWILAATFLEPVVPWRIDLTTLDRTWIQTGPGHAVQWVNAGSFVGPVAVLLAIVGAFAARRRGLVFAVIGFAFAWASLGSSCEPSLWRWLHALPVYRSMQAPERLVMYVTFALAVLAGFGASRLVESSARWSARTRRVAAALGAVSFLGPMVVFNAPIASTGFDVPLPPIAPRGEFVQGPARTLSQQWGGELYVAVLENRGNPVGQSDIPMQRAARGNDDPEYRGEVYFVAEQPIESTSITPNRIHVRASPQVADTLVVNQNYFPGWEVHGIEGARVHDRKGRIAVDVPAGPLELELRFVQPASTRGLVIGAIALAWLVVAARARSTAARRVVIAGQFVLAVATGLALRQPREPVEAVVPVRDGAPKVWVVDTSRVTEGAMPTLQRAIDAARTDDVIRVAAGTYDGFDLRKGLTIAPHGDGPVVIGGRVSITDVPTGSPVRLIGVTLANAEARDGESLAIERCVGVVMLQSVDVAAEQTGGAVAVRIRSSRRVQLFGCTLRAPGIALLADDAIVTMSRVVATAAQTAVRATRSRLLLSDLDARAPTAVAADDSTVDRRGLGADPSPPPSPHVRVTDANYAEPYLHVECFGTPGADGFVLVGESTAFADDAKSDGKTKRMVEFTPGVEPIPIRIPPEGVLKLALPQPGGTAGLGAACFVQLGLESAPGTRMFVLSLVDGALRTGP
ncbi:MAG: hypothetical protein IPH13_22405 [Planctomycetes bacterium]|nr:hypothetical protein [Planctomycetota bacterium]MCC7169934.1 hypothetical protein [Planctomycetota bacterium]